MQKVHFKRHGCGGWLELVGLDSTPNDYYYIQCQQHMGLMQYQLVMERRTDGQCIKHETIALDGEALDYQAIQGEIIQFIGWPVELEPFIESYYPSGQFSTIADYNHPDDRDIVNGADITGMTVAEAVEAANIDLAEYFAPWKMGKEVDAALAAPSPKIENMLFTDLYAIIHGCGPTEERAALLLGQDEVGGQGL